ncbi:hypothetical protein ABBQ32_004124 [Trebouxia sp. C0010 RCD-2024]
MPQTSSIAEALEKEKLCNSSRNAQKEVMGLVLAVMAERCYDKSRWSSYWDLLPDIDDRQDMPVFWDQQDLQPLRNTPMAEKLGGKWPMTGCHVEHPTQVEELFDTVVKPFCSKGHVPEWQDKTKQQQWWLYLWATAVVSAYSFTLGEDKFQAMVPLWDMLNHVTGQCNVRLHHSSKHEALQMITTKPIKQGDEIINNYGPCSDSELLRRFGFIEQQPNPHNGCEIPCAMLVARCQEHMHPSGAKQSSSDAAHISSNKVFLQKKVQFIQKHGLVPSDGWFKADVLGQPQDEMIEVVRLLLLTAAEFTAFEKQVDRWQCPLARPLTQMTSICHQVPHIIRAIATERLAALAEPCTANDQAGNEHMHGFRRMAAQQVLLIERRALMGLQLWLDKHDSTSLINCSKKVWMHLR